MPTIADRTFVTEFPSAAPRPTGEPYAFERCVFDNCAWAAADPDAAYLLLRNARLKDCRQRGCALQHVAIEDVEVDGLKAAGDMPLFLQGAVFRHVVLRGPISTFKLWPTPYAEPTAAQLTMHLERARQYYEETDWALDIRDAEFSFGPDLHFIPGELVRIDGETQVVVSRSAFRDIDLDGLEWNGSAIAVAVEWFLDESPYESAVIAAGRRSKAFKRDMAAIAMLRENGLASAAAGS